MKITFPHYSLIPGLALAMVIAGMARLIEHLEILATGKPWMEALVLAILLGSVAHTFWTPTRTFKPGIDCAAKTVLEFAVAIMGATISVGTIAMVGLPLIAAIICTVVGAIIASFLLGRLLGLPGKMALLIACGNAICGNSAIAAVAPVIDAEDDDVATSIAFTAVLGIGVVIAIPIVVAHWHLSEIAGGVLAGLTVYAVPQVIAAAGPIGAGAVQIGTLVKLVRVLMLGPVVTLLSLLYAQRRPRDGRSRHSIPTLLPPFILAFLALVTANSMGLLPSSLVAFAQSASGHLTVLAMAGLGLGVDWRSVPEAGPRVSFVVCASLLVLAAIAAMMLCSMGMG